MFKKILLFICLLNLFSGSVVGQKKKHRLSITDQIQQLLDQPAKDNSKFTGDLLITFIDSTGPHRVDKLASMKQTQSIDSQLFELGDLSHIFTSLLVHELANQGRVSMKISINDLVPDEFQSEHFQNVTLQDCLSHTTGLPRLPNNLGGRQIDHNQPFEYYRSEDLAEFIETWTPTNESKTYHLSQVGYAIVSVILEHQTGKSYDQLVQEVLRPTLGIQSLTASNLAQLEPGQNKIGQPVPPMRFSSFEASAGLKANRGDLEQWILQNLKQPTDAFQKTLSIYTPTGIDSSTSMASGWHHYKVNKHHAFYMQKGSSRGYSAFIGYQPTTKTAVLMLASQKTNLGPLGYHILGLLNDGWKNLK